MLNMPNVGYSRHYYVTFMIDYFSLKIDRYDSYSWMDVRLNL